MVKQRRGCELWTVLRLQKVLLQLVVTLYIVDQISAENCFICTLTSSQKK